MPDPERLLAPQPVRLERTEGAWRGAGEVSLWGGFAGPESTVLRARASELLARAGLRLTDAAQPSDAAVSLQPRNDLAPQSYRLESLEEGWRIEAGDAAGAFYGLCTLAQWLELHRSPDGRSVSAPCIRVDDAPSFPTRGAMLDVSRNRVPTMETLFELVDRFAALKLNHLQLYVEHTFAYQGHERVWEGWSPLTAEEIRALDDHCRERFVELAPNQNSFGHLHRWLVHDAYRPLAECPEGLQHPFGDEREPFSLCPTDPRSLELLGDLYAQLLPCFRSERFNVGLDETFDLGMGRSAAEVARVGRGRVYLDFLKRVHGLVAHHGRRMLFWGDIILEHPELIPELPEDVVALEWGYEADHPFGEHGESFASSGREFWVCPGTSSWLSFAGRATNALGNLASAAVHGREHGASGYLVTDWGDQGHLQPLPASYLGWLVGAGFGWNADVARRAPAEPSSATAVSVAEGVERWLAGDRAPGIGRSIWDLAEAYRLVGPTPMNRSALFSIVQRVAQPMIGGAFDALDREGLERTAAALRDLRAGLTTGAAVSASREGEPDAAARTIGGEQTQRELLWTADAMLLACELGLQRIEHGRELPVSELPAAWRGSLRDEAKRLAEELIGTWLARHRPGGLDASLEWWGRLERALETESGSSGRE